MTQPSTTAFMAETFLNLPTKLYQSLDRNTAECVLEVCRGYLELHQKHTYVGLDLGFKPVYIYGLEEHVIRNMLDRFPFLNLSFEYPGYINLGLHDGRSIQCGSQHDGWWLQFTDPTPGMGDEIDPMAPYASDGERDPIRLAWQLSCTLLRCPWAQDIFAGPYPSQG